MKLGIYILFFIVWFFVACNSLKSRSGSTANIPMVAGTDWRLGVGLWTFHTFNFAEALAKVDSAGIKYIEPISFQKGGPAVSDSLILQLSPSGIEKIKTLIRERGLTAESMYVGAGPTIASWQRQFEIAQQLGMRFVTAEPPLHMWDSIDSLAGVYGLKVAIHEHWKGMSPYWNPDTVLLAIKGHPNFGACADLGHWPKSGIDPLDGVKKLKGHIIGIHLKDIAAYNNPALKDVPVGQGVVNFPAIFKELKKQGFKGPIYIERDAEDQPSNLPSVLQTVRYYNEQVSKLK